MKVIITIEGGNVQSVFTEFDTDVVVIDFDIDGIDPGKLKKIPDVYYGEKPCFVSSYQQITDPERIGEIMKAIGRKHGVPQKYLMFGEQACRTYFEDAENGIDQIIEEEIEFGLYEFNGDIADMLYNFSGWGDYAFITKEEYEKLSEL